MSGVEKDETARQILPLRSTSHGEHYSTAPRPTEDPSIKNIGGFESLTQLLAEFDTESPGDDVALADVDRLISKHLPRFQHLDEELGMYYGNVVTHTIPGAYWIRSLDNKPEVRIAPTHTVDVHGVAKHRLAGNSPSLQQNLAHLSRLASHSPNSPD